MPPAIPLAAKIQRSSLHLPASVSKGSPAAPTTPWWSLQPAARACGHV